MGKKIAKIKLVMGHDVSVECDNVEFEEYEYIFHMDNGDVVAVYPKHQVVGFTLKEVK